MGTRRLSALLCALAALAVWAAPASAMSGDRNVALALWNEVQRDLQVPSGWTGSSETCTVGTESTESLSATVDTLDALRDFAGLPGVTFDEGLNHKALAAAMMMKAKGQLSHTPDPSWPCYSSDGADGAGHSNLFYGYSGPAAMIGYVEDPGNPALGHRFWLLDGTRTTFGSGSTGVTNALYVDTDRNAFPRRDIPQDFENAWPPEGYVPWPWVFSRWSLVLGGTGQNASFGSGTTVSVTANGQELPVHDVDPYGASVIWVTDVPDALRKSDEDLHVSITGATIDGQAHPVSYTVKAFDPAPLPPVRFVHRPVVRRADGRRGPVRRGVRLKVTTDVANGVVSEYQWLRNGRAVRGAERFSYRVRKADRGKRLSCRVTAAAPDGSSTASKTSSPVKVKRR
jgi:uncharacterized protein YkwD